MTDTIFCAACGSPCDVDGEFPKFFAWCEKCDSYCDMENYTIDWIASKMDKGKTIGRKE